MDTYSTLFTLACKTLAVLALTCAVGPPQSRLGMLSRVRFWAHWAGHGLSMSVALCTTRATEGGPHDGKALLDSVLSVEFISGVYYTHTCTLCGVFGSNGSGRVPSAVIMSRPLVHVCTVRVCVHVLKI